MTVTFILFVQMLLIGGGNFKYTRIREDTSLILETCSILIKLYDFYYYWHRPDLSTYRLNIFMATHIPTNMIPRIIIMGNIRRLLLAVAGLFMFPLWFWWSIVVDKLLKLFKFKSPFCCWLEESFEEDNNNNTIIWHLPVFDEWINEKLSNQ